MWHSKVSFQRLLIGILSAKNIKIRSHVSKLYQAKGETFSCGTVYSERPLFRRLWLEIGLGLVGLGLG